MNNNFNKIINYICKKNILIIIMLIVLCPILSISYASFIETTSSYKVSEMFVGKLLYSTKINGTLSNTITVEPGYTEATIEVTSLNGIDTNYIVAYTNVEGISVMYANDDNDPTYGFITNTKTSSILINNVNVSSVNVSFDVVGGYKTNNVSEILPNTGYTAIFNDYTKYDYNTIAMYIDDTLVMSLEDDKYYELENYSCTNGEEVTWLSVRRNLTIKDLSSKTKCSLYFKELDQAIFNFNYTGAFQLFTVPYDGYYEVELWGGGWDTSFQMNGAYTSGVIEMFEGEQYYIYVGQTSVWCIPYNNCGGAFNGGGAGGAYSSHPTWYARIGSGAGATDIRYFGNGYNPTASDLAWNSALGLNSRIMVAGGGARGSDTISTSSYFGAAGGLSGYRGIQNYGNGGTQTSGGSGSASAGGFGYGGYGLQVAPSECNNNDGWGGAGGYYGGGGALGGHETSATGLGNKGYGGGGSSFVSGHTGCVAIANSSLSNNPRTTRFGGDGATRCTANTFDPVCSYHYSNKLFTDTVIIDGYGMEWTSVIGNRRAMPNPDGGFYANNKGHSGNGRAKITYFGNSI